MDESVPTETGPTRRERAREWWKRNYPLVLSGGTIVGLTVLAGFAQHKDNQKMEVRRLEQTRKNEETNDWLVEEANKGKKVFQLSDSIFASVPGDTDVKYRLVK